jgi:PAS domain-containing protein
VTKLRDHRDSNSCLQPLTLYVIGFYERNTHLEDNHSYGSAKMSSQPQIDHVVLLLPYAMITSPPTWLTSAFTLSPGGRHADNRTENRLILFADGSYLELIAFIDDDHKNREGHWWDKPYGIVDWALTTTTEGQPDVKKINSRLENKDSKVRYDDPVAGGRKRPDGVELQWKVTFPTGIERGAVPFWCHDVTEREKRVPISKEATEHPSGVMGVAGLRVGIDEGRVKAVNEAVGAIIGSEDLVLGAPKEVEGLEKPWVEVQTASGTGDVLKLELVLQTADAGPQDIRQKVGDGEVVISFQ